MVSSNPSRMPKTSSPRKRDKVTTFLEIPKRRTNDYEVSKTHVLLSKSNKKADDP